MQDHLKERLTGAFILVAIVVLLVPEMFRGRPTVNIDRGSSSLEGPPLRSYTIDLRDTAAQPPAQTVPAASPMTVPAVAPTATVVATALPSAPTSLVATPAAAVAARASWVVQVGTFAHRELAEHMVTQVKARGFNVEAVGPDERGLYRVRSALLPNRNAAAALRQKMRAKGLKPIVNTLQ